MSLPAVEEIARRYAQTMAQVPAAVAPMVPPRNVMTVPAAAPVPAPRMMTVPAAVAPPVPPRRDVMPAAAPVPAPRVMAAPAAAPVPAPRVMAAPAAAPPVPPRRVMTAPTAVVPPVPAPRRVMNQEPPPVQYVNVPAVVQQTLVPPMLQEEFPQLGQPTRPARQQQQWPLMAAVVQENRPTVQPVANVVQEAPKQQTVIHVWGKDYVFDMIDDQVVMRFKMASNQNVISRLVCREWLVNKLKPTTDKTRSKELPCASIHKHSDCISPCIFHLGNGCTRPPGQCGWAHIVANQVTHVVEPKSEEMQYVPTASDFEMSVGTGARVSNPTTAWVTAPTILDTPVPVWDVRTSSAQTAKLVATPVRTDRSHIMWCNGKTCPGYSKCKFIHPETVGLARMDPSMPERIIFKSDLLARKIDFDALYVTVYSSLFANIELAKMIHTIPAIHRSSHNVYLNHELLGQIERLEAVDFGQLLFLWRSMANITRSEKLLKKFELDIEGGCDFALSTGRDSREEQYIFAMASLSRVCYQNKYGDLLSFVSRFAKDKKAELASFDEKVVKKYSSFCIPKERDCCYATNWCCHHGGHLGTNGNTMSGSVVTFDGLVGKPICDAVQDDLKKAIALRAEIYAEFSARMLEVLRINQDIAEEERRTGFKVVAREHTAARDKIASERANAMKEAKQCEMQIAMAEDRLARHVEAVELAPILKLKVELAEIKLTRFVGERKLANLKTQLQEELAEQKKWEVPIKRVRAEIKQLDGRLEDPVTKVPRLQAERDELTETLSLSQGKAAAQLESEISQLNGRIEQAKKLIPIWHEQEQVDRREQFKKQLAELVAQVEPMAVELDRANSRIATSNADIEALGTKLTSINARIAQIEGELQTESVEEEPVMDHSESTEEIIAAPKEVIPDTEEILSAKLGREQAALYSNKQFILSGKSIADDKESIVKLTAEREAAIKLASSLKVQFEAACEAALAKTRHADEQYAQMMEGRDIVKEARAKAQIAREKVKKFKDAMSARIVALNAENVEACALFSSLKAEKATAKTAGADCTQIDIKGKAAQKRMLACVAEQNALQAELKDEDSEYNQQLLKLNSEVARLEEEATSVLTAENLREVIIANKRDERLRELNKPVAVVDADLSDHTTVTLQKKGAKGRSSRFVWQSRQQTLSLQDRRESMEELVAKARAVRVASVPWLANMLKQAQELIIEARGTNALCPVAHFGYEPINVGKCMMQLKKQFVGEECVVVNHTFELNAKDFVEVGHKLERGQAVVLSELAIKPTPKPAQPVQQVVKSTGILARSNTRRFKKQDEDSKLILVDVNDIVVAKDFAQDVLRFEQQAAGFRAEASQIEMELDDKKALLRRGLKAQVDATRLIKELYTNAEWCDTQAKIAKAAAEAKAAKAAEMAKPAEPVEPVEVPAMAPKVRKVRKVTEAFDDDAFYASAVADKPVAEPVPEPEVERPNARKLRAERLAEEKKRKADLAAEVAANKAAKKLEGKASRAKAKEIVHETEATSDEEEEVEPCTNIAASIEEEDDISSSEDEDAPLFKTVREQKEERKVARTMAALQRNSEKLVQQQAVKSAKAEAKKAAAEQMSAGANASSAETMSKTERAEYVGYFLGQLAPVNTPNGKFWWFGSFSSRAKVLMTERVESQIRKAKKGRNSDEESLAASAKTETVRITRIGPMSPAVCSSVSERFKRMGLRNDILKEEGAFFIEYNSSKGQCAQSLSERTGIVLDELIKDQVFASCPPEIKLIDHILATFKVKVLTSSEKELNAFKEKGKNKKDMDRRF